MTDNQTLESETESTKEESTDGKKKKAVKVFQLTADISIQFEGKQKVHFCVFCNKLQKVISRHLKEMHGDEDAIRDLKTMPRKEQARFLTELKNRGDHVNNLKVIEEQKGMLVVARKPNNPNAVKLEDFGPCQCLKWLLKDQLFDHQTFCPANPERNKMKNKTAKKSSRGSLKKQSEKRILARKVLGPLEDTEPTKLEEHLVEVLSTLANDEIGQICRDDALIRLVGKSYLSDKPNPVEMYKNSKERMRMLGRLVFELRKKEGFENQNLEFFIHPVYWEHIIRTITRYALDEGKDTLSRKTGFCMMRAVTELLVKANINSDNQAKEDLRSFKELYNLNYTNR